MIARFAVAITLFLLAFDRGSYYLPSRNSLAIAVWWAIILGLAIGVVPRGRLPRVSVLTGGLLAALAVVTVASMAWAASAEKAFAEFNRVALYLGIFALVTLVSKRADLPRWADGIATAVAAIGLLALTSRLFPGAFPSGDIPRFLPAVQTRLSYPVGYWNGLAILMALGAPVLLRAAVASRRAWARGLAVGVLPALACVVYLASSRGGVAAAGVGICVFLALTSSRWAAVAALGVAALGSWAAIAVLVSRFELVNGPLESDAAASQGRSAAVLILLTCVAAGLVYATGGRLLPRSTRPHPLVGRVATAAVVVAALAGLAAANPVERFEEFKEPPTGVAAAERDFVKAHLLSGNGSGRWQFWTAALDQFQDRPFAGGGAGSYEAWWAEHRDISFFVKDAHSLYVESMAELGVVGVALVSGIAFCGLATLAVRIRRAQGAARGNMAALGGAFAAYLLGAGIDWMWELTVVSVVGFVLLALLTGPATDTAVLAGEPNPRGSVPRRSTRSRRGLFAGIVFGVASWLLICGQAIPLLAQVKISESQAAIEHDEVEEAVDDARAARNLQPWAASPHLQLALVQEQTADLGAAKTSIQEALDRDSRDWRLWLVAARLQTKLGLIPEARESLSRAVELNPRSPLFTDFGGGP